MTAGGRGRNDGNTVSGSAFSGESVCGPVLTASYRTGLADTSEETKREAASGGCRGGGGDGRAATSIDPPPLGFVALPRAALFGLVFQWGIFWVYVGIMAEQFVKFGIGLYRLRSREWINDVTQFSRTE